MQRTTKTKRQRRGRKKFKIPLPNRGYNITVPAHKDIVIKYAKIFVFDASSPMQDSYIYSNGCAKPDPSASTQPTGWDVFVKDLYAFYRPLSYRFKVTYDAQGAKPAIVWAYESNEVPSGALYVDNIGNPYFRTRNLTSVSGRGQVTISGSNTIDKVVGTTPQELMSADNYLAVTTYSSGPPILGYPPDLTYLGFGAQILDGTNLSASVIVGTVEIEWLVRIYDRHLQ
jgi:hypothetical protein